MPDAGGAKMRPVNFETMCHDCHTLGFDTLAPDREVPHGKVTEVIYMLNEYYAQVALEGGYLDAKSPVIVQERRRPGSPPLSQQQQQEALAWAREQTATRDREPVHRHGLHDLPQGHAAARCRDTWHIAPVRVSGVWFADAKFTHAKHTTDEMRGLPRRAQIRNVGRRADSRHHQLPQLSRRCVRQGQGPDHLHRLPRLSSIGDFEDGQAVMGKS